MTDEENMRSAQSARDAIAGSGGDAFLHQRAFEAQMRAGDIARGAHSAAIGGGLFQGLGGAFADSDGYLASLAARQEKAEAAEREYRERNAREMAIHSALQMRQPHEDAVCTLRNAQMILTFIKTGEIGE